MEKLRLKIANKHIFLDFSGVSFYYMDDYITYIFPWRRHNFSDRWFSSSFLHYYVSLDALEREWREYFLALQYSENREIYDRYHTN